MALSKAKGNMYNWVTHTWSCLDGECPHKCSYCYVMTGIVKRYPSLKAKYSGSPRLSRDFGATNLGEGKTIFVCHTNDLFAEGVPNSVVESVMNKCAKFPNNTYVFQSKNPKRMYLYLSKVENLNYMAGTTVETDCAAMLAGISKAPEPMDRMDGMRMFKKDEKCKTTFITIEPIMVFSEKFAKELIDVHPTFINIGADSKRCDLMEPSWNSVMKLVDDLKAAGVEIREKTNLDRLRK